jgi:Caspase domain
LTSGSSATPQSELAMDGTRSALIVASYDYQDPGLRRLRAPARDAEALARVLHDPAIGGFDVQTMLNEPSYVVNEAVEEFFDERGRDDLLLLHFSCHGVKDEGGELYFATANTRLRRLGATAVAADFVNRRMNRSRSRRVVLLLDCCYAGAFERGIVARAGAGIAIEEQFGGRGRAVITASSAMEYAFEGDQLADTQALQPSVFTSALVQGLETGEADRDQDGMVDLDELYDYVYDKVRAVTPNQTPGKWTFAVQGELYIARRSQPVTTPAALPPELQQVIDHPISSVRASAVQELQRLLESRHAGLALAAKLSLEQLVDDDSRTVSAAARAALNAHSGAVVAESSDDPQPEPPEASGPADAPTPLPPQQSATVPPPIPPAPIAPPDTTPITEHEANRSKLSPAPPSAPQSTPPHPSEPSFTKANQSSPDDAGATGLPATSPPDPTPPDQTDTPAVHTREPSAPKATGPPVASDEPHSSRSSPIVGSVPRKPAAQSSRGSRSTINVAVATLVILTLVTIGIIALNAGTDTPATTSASSSGDTEPPTSPPTTSAPPSTSPPPPAGKVLFRDGFADRAGGWEDVGPKRIGGHYTAGGYRLRVGPKGSRWNWPADAKDVYPSAGPRVRIDVKARTVTGSDQGSYGIACRATDTNAYAFEIGEQDQVFIEKETAAKFTELKTATTSAIRKNKPRLIQATCTNEAGQNAVHLMLWVNSHLVAQVTDRDHPLQTGTVALSATPYDGANKPIEAQFDDFVVMKL